MGLAARNATAPIPVARILRQGRMFVCGICRKFHNTQEQASGCVHGCFANLTNGGLVQVLRQWGRDAFRCKLCTRTYAQMDPAQKCGDECKKRLQTKLPPSPQVMAAGGAVSLTIQPKAKPRVAPKSAARPAPRSLAAATPAHAAAMTHAAAPVPVRAVAPPVAAATPAQAAAPIEEITSSPSASAPEGVAAAEAAVTSSGEAPKLKKLRDKTKKFHRDGARYICQECSGKYFTRDEVEACWDGHA